MRQDEIYVIKYLMASLKRKDPGFNSYISSLSSKLSDVKMLILKTLWDAGNEFPKEWVKSQYLLKITKQKYFDRRIRELQDELGCDIETSYHNNDHAYRLKSPLIKAANPRHYLAASQKHIMFEKFDYRCQICNKKFAAGVKGLQADHKIPLIRGGSQEEHNWQALCNTCNVCKRSACSGCNDDCTKCPWAFPEKNGPFILVKVPKRLVDAARTGLIKLSDIEGLLLKAWDENEARKIH